MIVSGGSALVRAQPRDVEACEGRMWVVRSRCALPVPRRSQYGMCLVTANPASECDPSLPRLAPYSVSPLGLCLRPNRTVPYSLLRRKVDPGRRGALALVFLKQDV